MFMFINSTNISPPLINTQQISYFACTDFILFITCHCIGYSLPHPSHQIQSCPAFGCAGETD